jgi:class 3 adenylate cyclase/predicted ATPase
MQCSSCGFENPERIGFCGRCGVKLSQRCPRCDENPPEFQFCGYCGASLSSKQDIPGIEVKSDLLSALPVPRSDKAERRQLTVVFCDLVDYTTLSEQLDPEDLREVVRAYQEVCADVIRRYDGYIAQYLGDGVLIYFGYPRAHEDDAQRAVRAGLEIIQQMSVLNTRLQQDRGFRLAVRIGISTGLVVVGEIGGGDKREQLALGDTLNIASRLQNLAEPDTVIISATSYHLVQGFFVFQELGSYVLKGFSQPMTLYRVLGESDARSRFDVSVKRGLTPLVGREQEIRLLLECWVKAQEEVAQIMLLTGEAGIGKSRLVQVLKELITGTLYTGLTCHCSPYYQNSVLYPIINLIQRALGLRREDSPEESLHKLETAVGEWMPESASEAVPLLASLLSLPLLNRYPPLALMPQRQREKTLETLLAILSKIAMRQPVLLVIEDLHWADPSTLELIKRLTDLKSTTRVLTVLTFRPEFTPPWSMPTDGVADRFHQITLTHLDREQIEVMIKRITKGKTLPSELIQQIITKTDGVPLLVEEVTKMILESSLLREYEDHYKLAGPLPALAIPTTVQDLLTTRLDQLEVTTVKEVAQIGSMLGREFSYELIQALVPLLDEPTLQTKLDQLVKAEIIYQRGIPPQAKYFFKHVLIQETAYASMLRSKRQQYHGQIAQVLQERFPENAEMQPELLAHHYTEASLKEQAIAYWQKAGQRAVERSAHVEAIGHFNRGLELLNTLPDTPEQTRQRLTLQLALGVPLIVIKGYAASEVERVYTQARELCRRVEETPQLFLALRGLVSFYFLKGELRTALELGEQCMHLTQNFQDPDFLLEAHKMLGFTLFGLGELISALQHLEKGIAIYNFQRHRSPAFLHYVADPGVVCLSHIAWILWFLGYPDQALKRSYEALTLAQKLSHPFSLVYALYCVTSIYHYCRDVGTTQERAEEVIILANEHGFPFWSAAGSLYRGWALAEQGRREEGIAHMNQSLKAYRSMGAEMLQPLFLALLAEAYGKVRQVEKGLTLLIEALTMAHRNGERFYEAELYRLKGELLLALSTENQAEAETCFHRALNITRSKSAKSVELRVTISLSRLLTKQGKREEARQMLAEIYGWFTEGFETADLKEARALLEELGEPDPS